MLATVQLVITIWAIVSKWDDQASYAAESISENRRLSTSFAELGKANPADFEIRYQLLSLDNSRRQDSDIKQEIGEAEMRMGLRAGLRQFQRSCINCAKTPVDMKSTECPICGNF